MLLRNTGNASQSLPEHKRVVSDHFSHSRICKHRLLRLYQLPPGCAEIATDGLTGEC